ncbi:hypothetical protein ACP70R_012279 [Stipagrostis hirtigluma subsp. patula]
MPASGSPALATPSSCTAAARALRLCRARFEKVVFERTAEAAAAAEADGKCTATVTAVIFEAGDCDVAGGADGARGQRVLCCTPGMAKLGACTEGALVHRAPNETAGGWPYVLAASFPQDGGLEAAFPDVTVAVSRTSMYTLIFVHCDASLASGSGQVVSAGVKTIWKNSRGYLPAGWRPFYGCMSLALAALFVYWFAQCARFWRDVVLLKSCATLVIALGMWSVPRGTSTSPSSTSPASGRAA